MSARTTGGPVTEVGEPSRQPVYVTALSRWPALQRLVGDRRVRYVFAGGVGAVVYYVLFSANWLLWSRWVPYLVIVVVCNFLTAVITFPIYRHTVFQYVGRWLPAFLRFYVSALWALIFTLVGLPLLVEVVHLHVLLASAIVIVLVPLVNYQIQRFWAFR